LYSNQIEVMEKVLMFKDFHQSKVWNEQPYVVEFKSNKARVISNEAFSKDIKSRFNKLIWTGKTTSGTHYCLTVNGEKAFFIAKYDINNLK
jgi:hypothetical protein